ncbi:MAG: SH3 domain-containing protein [Bacteroides sp.]|nr:SH3 domain-containing protein [Prevotella sp.]MCM1408529.1 SH3 domain-containing protein [Treponema brennaborense]MCM1470757.1 SH3 domain-containing protein [Bacteroides sp.]
MEKSSAADNFGRFRHRLLICCFFYAYALSAAAPFSHNELTAAPLSDYVFAGAECVCELTVPNVPPAQVAVQVQPLQSEAAFYEVRKSEKITDGMHGTSIEFVFAFSVPGTYRLPSVPARIQSEAVRIAFAPIRVTENPQTLVPQAVCVPKNPRISETGVCAGDVVRMELRARYFAQIHEISAELREDMLFIQKEQPVPLPYKRDTFQPDFETIAEFDWIPSAAGQAEIPPVYVTCDAWNGTKSVITAQATRIFVSSPKKSSAEDFAEAAAAAENRLRNAENPAHRQPAVNTEQAVFSEEQRRCAENIAAFRERERNSFFPRKFRQKRIAEERKAGLSAAQKNECPLWPFAAAGAALLSAAVLAVFAAVRHKKRRALQTALCCVFFAAALSFGIPAAVLRAPRRAVAFGGNIRVIPEHSGAARGSLYPGQCVRVLAEIGGWARIASGQSGSGWTEAENLIFYGQ